MTLAQPRTCFGSRCAAEYVLGGLSVVRWNADGTGIDCLASGAERRQLRSRRVRTIAAAIVDFVFFFDTQSR